MPYADVVSPRSNVARPVPPALAALAAWSMGAVLAAALAGCAGRAGGAGSGGASAAQASRLTRDASPAALATSPVTSTREWTWRGVNGLQVDTHHWSIRSSLRSASFTGSLPAFYEAALRNYRTGLVPLPAPPKRLETCVFGTRDEWARYTEHRLGADAGPYLGMGRGGFTSGGEAVLYDIGPRDTLSIAAHEGWHQYSQTTFRSALPVWLEEGIACFMEGFRQPLGSPEPVFLPWRNTERYAELRSSARKGRLSELRAVLEGSPQSFLAVSRDAQLSYYAQVWALVHFLRDGDGGRYRPGLERMLDDAVRGTIGERIRACDALDARGKRLAAGAKSGIWLVTVYLDADFDSFSRAYDRFVGALLESNGWDRILRGECPIDLPAPAPEGAP